MYRPFVTFAALVLQELIIPSSALPQSGSGASIATPAAALAILASPASLPNPAFLSLVSELLVITPTASPTSVPRQ
jgi:hypothetical protein